MVIATGSNLVAIYLSFFFIMLIVGKEGLVKISNLMFNGMDFTNIIRIRTPIVKRMLGAVISLIFCGLASYLLAMIYNETE
jgi:hypothetical protein